MFYLETKDGDKFFTNKDSDDKVEFERIIEDKLGKEASTLFNNLVNEDEENAIAIINKFAYQYKECIHKFDKVLNDRPVDTVKLEEVLADMQQLYSDMMR